MRDNLIIGVDICGTKVAADLRRLADYDIDEVFFETGRGPMPIAEQLDLVDEWRSELSA